MMYVGFTAMVAMLYSHAAIEACRMNRVTHTHSIREIGFAISYWGLCLAKIAELWLKSLSAAPIIIA